MELKIADQLELHYYLDQGSHSIDAVLRNKCEAELLAIFQEIASTLDLDIEIESCARREGGVKEWWKFIGTNNNQIALLLVLVSIALTRIPVTDTEKDALDKRVAELTIEEKTLAIEEKRLAIAKIKKEAMAGAIEEKTLENATQLTEKNLKIQVRKSNFYRNLSSCDKVSGVGFVPLDQFNSAVGTERRVSKSEFKNFVLFSTDLPIEKNESAKIEIVSPVLIEGNFRWKGFLNEELVSFSMKDEDFRSSVLRKEVTFQHGSQIVCVLYTHRKFDEVGEILVTGRSVITVLEKTDGSITEETLQGKKYKAQKKFAENQGEMFSR